MVFDSSVISVYPSVREYTLRLIAWTLSAYEFPVVLEKQKISDNDIVQSVFNRLTYDIPYEFSSTSAKHILT